MTISNITSISTVYANGPDSLRPGYNNLRTAVTDIFGATSTGYGYKNPTSSDVTQGGSIRAVDWNNLLADLNLIWQHQNNSLFTPTGTVPAASNPISSTWVNSLVAAINTADTKRYDRAATGQYTAAPTISSTFPATGTWGTSIQHRVTMTWPTESDANYFFNLGGQITFDLSYPSGSYTGDNATWTALIDGWKTAPNNGVQGLVYNRTKFQTGGTQTLFQQGSSNTITITVVKTSSRVLTVTTTLANVGVGTNLRVTNYFNYEYSTGAFNAPRPDVASVSTLGDTYTPVFVARKTLRVNTPTLYTYQAEQISAAQSIYLNNDGTVSLTVTGIIISSNNANVASVVTPGFEVPAVISPGTYRTFSLAYTSTTPGSYTSGFTISSDNDAGDITIPTAQSVTAIPFSFTVTPASISITKTDRTTYRQKINIIPANGSYTSYVPSFPGGQTGYTLDSTPPDGPVIIFTPGLLSPNTYATTVRITVNGIYVDVSVSINLTASLDQNLSTWLSPQAPDNSVIGMSYDFMGGKRYLTIGVGMGSDGSQQLSAGGSSYVSTAMNNLGISGDPNFLSGPVMYKVNDNAWSQFLKTYGAWPNTTGTPINVDVYRTFTFTAAAGTYNYECSFDNLGFFEVDGNLVGDMRNNSESWRTSTSGTFEITASGSHSITIHAYNSGGPGAMAVRITNGAGAEVWSTLNPIRANPAYLYWQEVYRFPISASGVKEELRSYYYCVKDTAAVDGVNRWGDYFGDPATTQTRSMFIVTDEAGNGNINVSMTNLNLLYAPKTLLSLTEAFYYYSASTFATRYTQLDASPTGDGSQTRKFIGFDQAGVVQTILAAYPRYSYSGGGGCPDPEVPIMLADHSTKPAGQIQVGDLLYTMHEHTREFGIFPVTAVEIEDQPMVTIVFTDDSTLTVSRTHKFFMASGDWKQVFELGQGDIVKGLVIDKTIQNVTTLGLAPAVKITVADAHTYIADEMISHNVKAIVDETIVYI